VAREKIVQYKVTDDFTGDSIEETEAEYIKFQISGVEYSFEVGAATRTKFKTALKAFIAKGDSEQDEDGMGPHRRVLGRAVPTALLATSEKSQWLARVREWAGSNGHKVAEKGRIAQKVTDAYTEANPNDPEPDA